MRLAGRQTAESWLGARASDPALQETRVGAMAACLSAAVAVPLFSVPVLLTVFSWPQAIAGTLAAAAIPLAAAGLLSATGSPRAAGHASLAMAALALTVLAVLTGGLASPFLPLLALLPLEAAFHARQTRGLAAGIASACAALALVLAAVAAGLAAPAPDAGSLAAALPFGLYALLRGAALALAQAGARMPEALAPAAPAPARRIDTGVFDRLPGLITLHDARGEVTHVGGAGQGEFASRIGDLSGKGFVNRIHVADRIAFLDALDRLRRGENHRSVELRFEARASAGQFVHVAIFMSAERGPDGAFSGILAQTRDISAQVADRSRAQAVAEEAESANAAKTRFLAAVSHELRTPLNAIIGFSDILAREYFGAFNDERQREYVGLIHQSGEHLLSVVNTMLDMSKIEAGRYDVFVEPFALTEVIDSCDAMLRLQAGNRGVALTKRVAKDVGEIVADRRAMHQILINLVGNAIKFTEAGGVVNVDATLDGGHLKLVVSDTGIGIPADKLARIGEPFMQAQGDLARHYEGSGLGLSLVKGLVALHGGAFIIDSVEGEGTVVTIELPADGSGANGACAETAAEAVAFPPVLTRPAISAPMTDDQTRNEDHAETALSA